MLKKNISIISFLLFFVPVLTLFICFQIIAYYYPDFHTIPFIDGKASISRALRSAADACQDVQRVATGWSVNKVCATATASAPPPPTATAGTADTGIRKTHP